MTISDIQLAVLKTSAIVIIAAAVAALLSASVTFPASFPNFSLEGMANPAAPEKEPKPGKIPDEDDDLKCAGPKRKDVKCTVPDVLRLGYELASDPSLSQSSMEKIGEVFKSRSAEKGNKKLGEKLSSIFNRFIGDVMLLRFSIMFNTSPNEPELKNVLDEMVKKKDAARCYSLDDMKQVKGLLVGTAEQKTLSVAQSEAVRCYMQRFNSVRACLGICDSNRA
jgi:hypothetical protein